MPNNFRNLAARSMMLAAFSSICITAAHAADEPLKDLVYGGSLDIYYQNSFNRPGIGATLNSRQLDVKQQSLSLSALQLNVMKKTTAENPFGFTLQLVGGKATDILHTAEPGGKDTYKAFQQAYVTYASKDGTTLDFGKFLTWIGYEGVIPANNDLYSIGFLFYFCQPTYHVGLRASKTLPGGVGASLYLVNGWNEAEDSNANKSYGATVTKTFGSTTITANYYGGVEGSQNTNGFYGVAATPGSQVGKSALNLGDLIVVSQVTPKLKLALNADLGNLKAVDGGPKGSFRGIAGTAKYALSTKLYGTVRYETVSDPDGVRSGIDGRFNSVTAGLEYNMNPNSVLRLEYRSDNSNSAQAFESDNGGTKRTRDTLTIAHVLRF